MPLGIEVRLGPGDFALDGNPAPPAWIKMPLSTKVGLSLIHI